MPSLKDFLQVTTTTTETLFRAPFLIFFFMNLADKDYIPGPGEYDVPIDDGGRHKRYGFLSQSDRFTEGTQKCQLALH